MALIGSGCPKLPRLPITARAATRPVSEARVQVAPDALRGDTTVVASEFESDRLDTPSPAPLALVTAR